VIRSEVVGLGEAMGRQLGRVHRKGNKEEKEWEQGRLEIRPKRLLGLNKVFSISDLTLGSNKIQIQMRFDLNSKTKALNQFKIKCSMKCNKEIFIKPKLIK
jgi:hypothetical protein